MPGPPRKIQVKKHQRRALGRLVRLQLLNGMKGLLPIIHDLQLEFFQVLPKRLPYQICVRSAVFHQQHDGGAFENLCVHEICSTPGTVNRNVDPFPASDSTQMRPPCRCTIFWQIAKPIPVPEYDDKECSLLKIPKICVAYCGSIPIPLSATANSQ